MDPVKVTQTYQDPNDPSHTITEVVPEVSREHVERLYAQHSEDLIKDDNWVTLTPVTDFDGKHLIVNPQGSTLTECQPIEAFDNQQLTIRWPHGEFQVVTIVLMREEYGILMQGTRRRRVVSYMPGFYHDVYGAMIWIPLYKVRVHKAWAAEHTKKITREHP